MTLETIPQDTHIQFGMLYCANYQLAENHHERVCLRVLFIVSRLNFKALRIRMSDDGTSFQHEFLARIIEGLECSATRVLYSPVNAASVQKSLQG